MIRSFRKIRQRLLSENKFTKYLLYASGEIVLVMIGILLALQVNNWNEQRKKNKELKEVRTRVALDIGNDLADLQSKIDFWEYKRPLFDSVRYGKMTEALLDQGADELISTAPFTVLSKTGVELLKETKNRDALTLKIIEIYDYLEEQPLMNEREIRQSMYDMVDAMMKYEWFHDYKKNGLNSKSARGYFLNDKEYINRLIYSHNRIYTNYLRKLEYVISVLKEARNELRIKNNPNYKPLTKDGLEQYIGSFKLDTDSNPELWYFITDTIHLEIEDDILKLKVNKWKSSFIEYFETNEDTFIHGGSFFNLTMTFERNDLGEVTGFKLYTQSRSETSIKHFIKLKNESE